MNECLKLESDADRKGICMFPSCGFLLFCLGQITVCPLYVGGCGPKRQLWMDKGKVLEGFVHNTY